MASGKAPAPMKKEKKKKKSLSRAVGGIIGRLREGESRFDTACAFSRPSGHHLLGLSPEWGWEARPQAWGI